jgi:hypothetical protein
MMSASRIRQANLFVLISAFAVSAFATPAAEMWSIWNTSRESSPAAIDHAEWQWFLDQYVTPGDGGINLVAYRDITAADRQRLQSYLKALSQIDPRDYARAEQLAYWVNLYNALTVEVIATHPAKSSILRMGEGLFSVGPWNDDVITIAGIDLTLNDIEHRILRPIWNDRRIHYALNCASIGCPNLDRQAYTRGNGEQLLSANEIAYINHRRGVEFDERGRLVVSQIYEWYGADFVPDSVEHREGLLGYLASHHATLSDKLNTYEGRIRYAYDWTLNGRSSR